MYIEPNTIIRILKNVPLDNTYKHTIFFPKDNISVQTNYFFGLTKYLLTDQTFQRVRKGVMRVQVKAEDLYDCNYIMFQNANFSSKWFYAFITGVEYVNNIVSEITYEIDVMQTWFYECTLQECYVEREHSTSDSIGSNIVAEPVDLGPIICTEIQSTGMFDSYVAVIAKARDSEEE